jgi:hypothetical protein
MKWGMQAFDTFKVVPPGHRHRPPGQPRVPRQRRAQGQGRRLLPRHPGRHRQPHHDDQRHRRRGLGRGRHRGRGRHARPAGLFPHARRRRRAPDRASCARASPPPTSCSPSPRCCARPRSSASSSSSSAPGTPPRCRPARPRDHRQHGARIRRDDGLLPGRRPSASTTSAHRPHRSRDRRLRGLLQGAGPVGIPQKGDIDYSQVVELDLDRRPERRRPEAPAGPHRAGKSSRATFTAVLQAGRRERLRQEGRATRQARIKAARSPRHQGRRHHGDVLIAAITSCTNTSNPSVLLAAGLLAKKAVEKGLKVNPTSRPRWPPARAWSPTT